MLLARQSCWNRLWVVQEIMCSRVLHFLCGRLLVDSEDLKLLIDWFEFVMLDRSTVEGRSQERSGAGSETCQLMITLVAHKRSFPKDKRTLRYAIETFGHLQCQDVRDKIYSLLTLIQESQRIKVDYSIDRQRLFFDLLSRLRSYECNLETRPRLDIALLLRELLCLDNGGVSDKILWDVSPDLGDAQPLVIQSELDV